MDDTSVMCCVQHRKTSFSERSLRVPIGAAYLTQQMNLNPTTNIKFEMWDT